MVLLRMHLRCDDSAVNLTFQNHSHRITDAAFDFTACPFEAFVGCLSLESISLQVYRLYGFFVDKFYSLFFLWLGLSANYRRNSSNAEQELSQPKAPESSAMQKCSSALLAASISPQYITDLEFSFHRQRIRRRFFVAPSFRR